jgi:hypothetical protein
MEEQDFLVARKLNEVHDREAVRVWKFWVSHQKFYMEQVANFGAMGPCGCSFMVVP